MPYPHEHSVRYHSPSKKRYIRFRRVNDAYGRGISAIYGILRHKIGERKTEVQALRFNADIYTLSNVKQSVSHKEAIEKFGHPLKIEAATRNNPVHSSLARYEKSLQGFLKEEEQGIKDYKKLIASLPMSEEGDKVRHVLNGILRDEEKHAVLLRRILYF